MPDRVQTESPGPATFEKLLVCRINALEKISGGRNSRVFRITAENGSVYLGKQYHTSPTDPRDRLGNEFKALTFLWNSGFRTIPRPVKLDASARLAVYSFVEGERLTGSRIAPIDIDQLVSFVADLKAVGAQPDSRSLPPASDACLSGRQIVSRIQSRLDRFAALQASGAMPGDLADFLDIRFQPALEKCCTAAAACLKNAAIGFEEQLPLSQRTLSPSDFGFHNALKRPDGTLIVVDLEYFGWDDPAKLVNDFLLHPANRLPTDLCRRFQNGICKVFSEQASLPERIAGLRPLFGLNWCLILLNEFLPADAGRRQFATGDNPRRAPVRRRQLEKAARMLDRALAAADF